MTGAITILFGALFLISGAKAIIFGASLFGDYFIIFGAYFSLFGAFFDMIGTSLHKGPYNLEVVWGKLERKNKDRAHAWTPNVFFVVAPHYQSFPVIVLLLQACLSEIYLFCEM